MNTCPSDSKVFGRRDSKSATERGDYPGRAVGRTAGSKLGKQQLFFGVAGTQKDFTIATVRYHENTSVSQYGA